MGLFFPRARHTVRRLRTKDNSIKETKQLASVQGSVGVKVFCLRVLNRRVLQRQRETELLISKHARAKRRQEASRSMRNVSCRTHTT